MASALGFSFVGCEIAAPATTVTEITVRRELQHLKQQLRQRLQQELLSYIHHLLNQQVTIAARGSGGVYSGDIVDVTVKVTNSGKIEAKNVIARLVLSKPVCA